MTQKRTPKPPPYHAVSTHVFEGSALLAVCQSNEIAEGIVEALIAHDKLYRCPICKIFVGADAMPHHVTLHVDEVRRERQGDGATEGVQ